MKYLILTLFLTSCATVQPPSSPVEKAPELKDCAEKTFCWDSLVLDHITPAMLSAKVESFCPQVSKLDKKTVLLNVIKSMAFAESGWKPNTTYTESTMGIDPVTKKQVESEGLYQLSYQDARNWASLPECKAIEFEKKNIRDPLVNSLCAFAIMDRLSVRGAGKDISSTSSWGAYWSSARLPYKDAKGKWHHEVSRAKMKKLMPSCF